MNQPHEMNFYLYVCMKEKRYDSGYVYTKADTQESVNS